MTGTAGAAGQKDLPFNYIANNKRNPIKHVLADGREMEDMEGFVIPMSGQAAVVYQITTEFARKIARSSSRDENVTAPCCMEETGWTNRE